MFAERDGGTAVRDDVRAAVFGGLPTNRLLVAPGIRRIFAFRQL